MAAVTQQTGFLSAPAEFLRVAGEETKFKASSLDSRYNTHLKTRAIAAAFFFLSSAAVMTRHYFPSASRIIVGIGALGMLASAIYGVYHHYRCSVIRPWKEAFNQIAHGDVFTGLRIFEQSLKAPYCDWDFDKIFLRHLSTYRVMKREPSDIIGCDPVVLHGFLTFLIAHAVMRPLRETRPADEAIFPYLKKHMAWAYAFGTHLRGGCPEGLVTLADHFKNSSSAVEVINAYQAGR